MSYLIKPIHMSEEAKAKMKDQAAAGTLQIMMDQGMTREEAEAAIEGIKKSLKENRYKPWEQVLKDLNIPESIVTGFLRWKDGSITRSLPCNECRFDGNCSWQPRRKSGQRCTARATQKQTGSGVAG